MQTKIRKYQNILVCAGEGTILFGLWGFFRVILMFTLGEEKKMLKEAMATFSSQERMISWIAVSAVILVIGAIMVWLHLYIGLSAIREGHGTGKRKRGFLRLAAFLVVLDFLSVSSYFSANALASKISNANGNYAVVAASFLMDVTAMIMYAEILFCCIRLRMMQKILEQQQAGGAL